MPETTCRAVMKGPNKIKCAEPWGHRGPHKSKEMTQTEFDSKWAGPAGTKQIHWADELCTEPQPKVSCPGCEYPIKREEIEDNGLCAMCNGAEGTIW